MAEGYIRTEGFIKLHRRMFEHWLWDNNKPLSKAEAWIDILRMARYEASITKRLLGGKLISWGRGQLVGSSRFLKKSWRWKSNSTVEKFINLLEKENMISINIEQGIRVITICNYDEYNPVGSESRTDSEQEENTRRTLGEHSANETERKERKDKKEEEVYRDNSKKFETPDLETIKVYFKAAGSTDTEAERFFNFYDSKNWMVGKNKMSKWKSAASGWLSRNGTSVAPAISKQKNLTIKQYTEQYE
jgi:hypothetical protein